MILRCSWLVAALAAGACARPAGERQDRDDAGSEAHPDVDVLGEVADDAEGVPDDAGGEADASEMPDVGPDVPDVPAVEADADADVPTVSELCDGVDNDSDGQTDEGFDLGAACTAGTGECETPGRLVCAPDGLSAVCDAQPPPGSAETCNTRDDDCDGLTDEYGTCAASCFTVSPGTVRCSYPLPVTPDTTPALGLDGTVYFTGSDIAFPRLHALDPENCTAKWVVTFDTEGFFTTPAVGEDGTIYVGFKSMFADVPSRILAYRPNGTPAWSLPFAGRYIRPQGLALGADGTIYFGDSFSRGQFYAVTADGNLKWQFPVGQGGFQGMPAVGADGRIYAGTGHYPGGPPAAVYAFADLGHRATVAWEFAPADGEFSVSHSPAIGANGTVYVGLFLSSLGQIALYALDPATGREIWRYNMDAVGSVASALAIAADGTVYARSSDGRIHAVRPDGTGRWTYDGGTGGWHAAPVLGADGTVCIGGRPSAFLCLDGSDGSLRWEATIAGHAGRPTIAPNGAIFFHTGSAVYALCGPSPGLANAPWPKDLHDERNTANSRGR